MAIGPVQLIVLGFDEPEFKGEVLAELDRLKENDVVRVIDGLAVYKNENGEVTTLKRTDLSDEEAAELFGISSMTSTTSCSWKMSTPSAVASAPAAAPPSAPSSPAIPRPIRAPTTPPNSAASSSLRSVRLRVVTSPFA